MGDEDGVEVEECECQNMTGGVWGVGGREGGNGGCKCENVLTEKESL